jgi:hypothetical protein
MAKKNKQNESTARKATTSSWVVTTSSDRPVADIAKELSAAGFKIDQTLDQIGIITGKADETAARKARSIRGVSDVSPETKADVGPPNSRETW